MADTPQVHFTDDEAVQAHLAKLNHVPLQSMISGLNVPGLFTDPWADFMVWL